MFREVLLESSPAMRRRNPWPLATAFTVQMITAGAAILLSLASTGLLPLSSHVPLPAPPRYTPMEEMRHSLAASSGSHDGASLPNHPVVQILNTGSHIPSIFGSHIPKGGDDPGRGPNLYCILCAGTEGPVIDIPGRPIPRPQPATAKRVVVSNLVEAMILNKVVPEYPRIAKLAGIQGDVKLHAIIGTDGSIQSLTVTSGPDMLKEAALKAVEQWKYRPYMLNGQAVEVETIITVTFHRF